MKTHRNLLLRARHIRKISARLRRLARRVPLPLDHMHLRPVLRRHRRLERVRLAGEVALAFVLDLFRCAKAKPTNQHGALVFLSPHKRGAMRGGGTGKREKTHRTQPPTRTRDPARLRQLNIRTPIPQPVDPEPGQRNDIFFLGPVREVDRERGVPDLLYDDGSA